MSARFRVGTDLANALKAAGEQFSVNSFSLSFFFFSVFLLPPRPPLFSPAAFTSTPADHVLVYVPWMMIISYLVLPQITRLLIQ